MNTSLPVSQFLNEYRSGFIGGHLWVDSCINELKYAARSDPDAVAEVLVNFSGVAPTSLADVWGISTAGCQQYCSRPVLEMKFDYTVFSAGLTNYFLPWLFLSAQLPFDTGSSFKNFMSLCLAIGSPMLITFSLFSTALNGNWIYNRFQRVTHSQDGFFHLQEAAKAARDFLRTSQQSTIRINTQAFTQLFTNDETVLRLWWKSLYTRLKRTRRPFTFSLMAQGLFAVIVWALTIAGNFVTGLGIPSQALLLSSGTLWVWLIPVIVGWVLVGSQSMEDGISNALLEYYDGGSRPETQVALQARSGFAHSLESDELPDVLWSKVQGDERLSGPTFNYARIFTTPRLAASVASAFEMKLEELRREGDPARTEYLRMSRQLAGQRQPSPQDLVGGAHNFREQSLNNYEMTRKPDFDRRRPTVIDECSLEYGEGLGITSLPTSPDLSRGRSRGTSPGRNSYDSTHKRQLSPRSRPSVPGDVPHVVGHRPSLSASLAPVDTMKLNVPLDNLRVLTRASYGSTVNGESEPRAYAEWRDLDSSWKRNIVVSNAIAFFLQWGITGAAVVIAYNTPAYGIGCRPSSYLLYAILSTAAHMLLFSSVFLSHDVMLSYQNGTARVKGNTPRSRRIYITSALAVIARVTGKAIAIANTFWIILSSIFELVGLYNSCFCEASMLIPKATSWVLLFSSQSGELRHNAGRYWAGGIVMSAMVCMITCWIVFLYRTRA